MRRRDLPVVLNFATPARCEVNRPPPRPVPQCADHVLHDKRLLPAVGKLAAIGAGDGIGPESNRAAVEQVGRHAVAVRFDVHCDAGYFCKAPPAFEQGNAGL
jgi:hypothetical protein